MDLDRQTINRAAELLLGPWSDDEFSAVLSELGELVSETSSSAERRAQVVGADGPKAIEGILLALNPSQKPLLPFLRLVRGFYLLLRNVGSIDPSIDPRTLVPSIDKVLTVDHAFNENIIVSWLQSCSNSLSASQDAHAYFAELAIVLKNPLIVPVLQRSKPARQPLVAILANYLQTNSIDLLFDSPESTEMVHWIAYDVAEIADVKEPLDFALLEVLERMVGEACFTKWISGSLENEANIAIYMRSAQKLVTSGDDWDSYKLTGILAWMWDVFKEYEKRCREQLTSTESDAERLENSHAIVVAFLDTVSHLCMFDKTRQFLVHYGAVDTFVLLLRTVHDNTRAQTLKEPKITELAGEKHFPEAKSILIEILAQLAHENFNVQETIRESGGLNVILSCCVIDNDNPFIRERAILCIKQLLAGNQKNQDFVRGLQAQTVVDQGVLEEVGYDVKIEDGKVRYEKLDK